MSRDGHSRVCVTYYDILLSQICTVVLVCGADSTVQTLTKCDCLESTHAKILLLQVAIIITLLNSSSHADSFHPPPISVVSIYLQNQLPVDFS